MAQTTLAVKITGDSRDLVQAFKQAEKGASDFGRKVQNDLSILADWAKKGALALGAIFTTVAGLSLKGGIDRLMGLERASRQLQQLGVEGSAADKLMDSLLDTLRGTPFALDKGAKSLAGFVASGRDLRDIPRLIDQVTDAAAFGNTTLEDMDFIWQQIQTTGRVTNQELRMLAERNIPVYTQLAGAIGVTAQEVFDMASTGKISADLFFNAWEQAAEGTIDGTVRISGAAKSMGETTEGAWGNMRTAMSRFGATLLTDVFPLAKDVFTAIGEGFDRMGGVFKRVGAGLDTSGIKEWIADIPDLMEDVAEGVVKIWQETKVFRDVAGLAIQGVVAILETKLIPALGAAYLAARELYAHPVIAGLGLLLVGIGAVKQKVDETRDAFEALVETALRAEEIEDRFAALREIFTERELDLIREAGVSISDLIDGSLSYADALAIVQAHTESAAGVNAQYGRETFDLRDKLRGLTGAEKAHLDAIKETIPEHRELNFQRGRAKKPTDDLADATEGLADETDEATSALQRYEDEVRSQTDPLYALVEANERLGEATDAVAKAAKEHGKESPEYIDALMTQAQAFEDVKAAQLKVADQSGLTRDAFKRHLSDMGIFTESQIDLILADFDRVNAFRFSDKRINVSTVHTSVGGTSLGGLRQHGGPVSALRPYIVGEAGPELFVPQMSGMIVPNHQLAAGGGGGTWNVNVNGVTDTRALAHEIVREGAWQQKTAGV